MPKHKLLKREIDAGVGGRNAEERPVAMNVIQFVPVRALMHQTVLSDYSHNTCRNG